MKLHKVSALAAVSILAFAACSTTGGSVLQRRVDGFMGFRHATEALTGARKVLPQPQL